jgi:hypothetical protein
VTVNPVNNAPTLDTIPDVVVTQPIAAGANLPITVPLSGITSGAANENLLLTLSATVSVVSSGASNTGTFTYTSPATVGQYSL